MLTANRTRLRQRRGVALILILGMLGLLALIGVTFATFTGQARVGARNYAQSVLRPQTGELMDYALSQLIGDTNDVRSAIRGHSIARDMYGNDAANNGYVDTNPTKTHGELRFLRAAVVTAPGPWRGAIRAEVNVEIGAPAFYGYDFTRWVVKFEGQPGAVNSGVETRLIGQTFEVIGDDTSGAVGDPRVFYLTPPASTSPIGAARPAYVSPDVHPTVAASATSVGGSVLIGEAAPQGVPVGVRFVLDGRFLRAFNGPGMGYVSATQPPAAGNLAAFANMRYNGGILSSYDPSIIGPGDPNSLGMDEDYDACDLENWFLAIQSADGKVIIPSFHRPGILERTNWSGMDGISRSKILRPRRADGHSAQSFPDLTPNDSDGRIEFDVDNDGDGLTDSVWVDLGYPAIKDSRGLMYKPLFAFMVIGLNGRIPLNTAGNLQMRGGGGNSLRNMHTSRLGISPSEVDPTFGLQNAPPVIDPLTGNILVDRPQLDNAGVTTMGDAPVSVNVTQLRNLLTGTRPYDSNDTYADQNYLTTTHYDPVTLLPTKVETYAFPNNVSDIGDDPTLSLPPRAVPGRWGEVGLIPSVLDATAPPTMSFLNPVRAGGSTPMLPAIVTPTTESGADGRDGNNTTFDYWPLPTDGENPTASWPADYYDAAGDFALPVERTRRFVTPFDLYGDGRVAIYRAPDTPGDAGADNFGRVAFDKYFRPPGIPVPTESLPPSAPTVIKGEFPPPPTTVSDITNNPLHGYESYRNSVLGTDEKGALRYGSTPTNMTVDASNNPVPETTTDGDGNTVQTVTSNGRTIPSYNSLINSLRMHRGISEADQMSLYGPTSSDQPFGHQDLEWLYRSQDREGPSLFSRLADLAPLSFRDSVDAQRRRRLFSIDTWESNAIVWANDNPGGRFSDNSRFTNIESASLATLALNHSVPYLATAGNNVGQSSAPPLAHRDRKINLNYPLPVSNDPDEPTRRKWITESYQLLKTMLPPLSLDTPEELAMLSQFVVNIVDFRDPDATMTRFTNPDVLIRPGAANIAPTLVLASASAPGDLPLVQYGMEYNPIAINEVLAYGFQSKAGGGTGGPQSISRFFIELVNTLTEPRSGSASTLNLGGFDYTASNPYANGCWDLIFADDNPDTRPDPFTGQLLPVAGTTGRYAPIPLNRESFVENRDVTLRPLDKDGVPATGTGTNYFYVLGNSLSATSAERNSPSNTNPDANNRSLTQTIKPEFDPMTQAASPAAPTITFPPGVLPPSVGGTVPPYARIPALAAVGATEYKWVCLRRPVNPFAPVSADNPMVVVDSMRFHFIEGTGKTMITDPTDGPVPDLTNANRIYSTQRYQPYRGGHTVLNPLTSKLDPRYGYTEQLNGTNVSVTNTRGVYVESSGGATAPPHYATDLIYSSLGKIGNATTERDTQWDYFVFNDRDFVSLAELLLVPGCPPGLFTKQFVEFAPSVANTARFSTTPPPTAPPPVLSTPNFTAKLGTDPHTYPYLVDRLFYTSASPALNGGPTWDPVRGPSAGGWYKMFEVFEVPSRAAGAVASAANGYNYDWFRQDVRPGQLNLNLIIDEEVFLGLMGNAGLRTDAPGGGLQQVIDVPEALNGTALPFLSPDLNGNPVSSADITGINAQRGFAPLVVTEWDPNDPAFVGSGAPTGLPFTSPPVAAPVQRAAYPPSNVGFYDASANMSTLKYAFTDFLKIRHGGTGYMFGPLPEAPFRSLSYPDINYTIMRPAFATANVDTANASIPDRKYYWPDDHGRTVNAITGTGNADAGVKNPALLDPTAATFYPPAIPPRRLFQLPDNDTSSNAYNLGDTTQLGYTPPANAALQRSRVNLTDSSDGDLDAGAQHPYWRSEWMQKMMNLSTVRTHQYAVWVTVGFFEVVSQGDPAAAGTNPDAAYDVIGREVGLIGGKNVRHRGFFIVDRLKLDGFDPTSPGKFRDAVLYRRMIQ